MTTDTDAAPAGGSVSGASGRCLCGAVSYTVVGPLRDVFECHCERCRRFTGHHMAATAADADQVCVEGEPLRWFSPDPAVEYGFCSHCGSSMFWRSTAPGERMSIAAGTLDQPTGLRTTEAWWVDAAADYIDLPPRRVEHSGDG